MEFTSTSNTHVSTRPFRLSRWWFVAVLILLLGILPRYIGYKFQLPYLDELDEAGHFWNTMSWRGVYPVNMQEVGYPPGIFFVDSLAQSLIERSSHDWIVNHIADAVALARLWAIGANLLTALLIGLTARLLLGTYNQLLGEIGGWLAMVVWLIPSDIIFHSVYALPAAWVMLFDALALYAALVSMEKHQPQWAVVSVLAALVAILFKYSEAPMLIFGVLVTVLHLRRPTRRWLIALICEIVAIAVCAVWLLVAYHASQITTWQVEFTEGSSSNFARLFSPGLNWRVGQIAAHQLGLDLVVCCLLVLAGTWLVWRGSRGRLAWLLLIAFTLGHISIALGFYYWDYLLPRYVVPASIGLAPLIVVILLLIVDWTSQRLRTSAIRYIPAMVAAALLFAWLGPQIASTYQFASDRNVPDTRGAVQAWAFQNLDDGGVITTIPTHKVFNREWGGYDGATRLNTQQPIYDRLPAAWRGDGYRYALLDPDQFHWLADHATYRAGLLLLKSFPPADLPGRWSGPDIYVFRLWPMQHSARIDFGQQVRLVGWDQTTAASTLNPGDKLTLTLYWQSLRPPTDNFNVFVHLYPEDRLELLAQTDGSPGGPKRPTLSWQDPGETIVGEPLTLQIPNKVEPACYRLVVGLYNYQSLERLSTGSRDYAVLETVCIGAITL